MLYENEFIERNTQGISPERMETPLPVLIFRALSHFVKNGTRLLERIPNQVVPEASLHAVKTIDNGIEEKSVAGLVKIFLESKIAEIKKSAEERIQKEKKCKEKVPSLKPKKVVFKNDIDPSKMNDLIKIENKILRKIATWKDKSRTHRAKIECAAFCDMLWHLDFFKEKIDRLKTCADFARSRYGGIEIRIQLLTAKNQERNKHKILLAHLFKKLYPVPRCT